MRKISKEGLALIKRWEGLRLSAYEDSNGVWTIGYGHTSATGAPHVHQNMQITKMEAEEILFRDLRQFEQVVEQTVTVPLSDEQFIALVSFAYKLEQKLFVALRY